MNPFDGQRRLDVRAEQVVWHLVSAGVLGLLLLALVLSVALLDGASGEVQPANDGSRVARPVEDEGSVRATFETSSRCEPAVPVVHPVEAGLPFDRVRGRAAMAWITGA